jgi:2Fe-2S ferredoxin
MPKITFIEHTGQQHVVDAPIGSSLMQAAVNKMIPGIIGDCGGNCSCATCQVYVMPEWTGKLQPKQQDEESLLEGALNVRPNSRLGCQIIIESELDGLVVELPVTQV